MNCFRTSQILYTNITIYFIAMLISFHCFKSLKLGPGGILYSRIIRGTTAHLLSLFFISGAQLHIYYPYFLSQEHNCTFIILIVLYQGHNCTFIILNFYLRGTTAHLLSLFFISGAQLHIYYLIFHLRGTTALLLSLFLPQGHNCTFIILIFNSGAQLHVYYPYF